MNPKRIQKYQTYFELLNLIPPKISFIKKHLKVNFLINGDKDSTEIRCLNENNKSVLKKSSVDSFIMAVKE